MERELLAILMGGGMFTGLLGLGVYVYFSFCLMKMAQKVNLTNGWWGFIPILNLFLLVQIASKEWWWVLLFLIPLANIVFMVIVWMKVAERLQKPSWYGILMIIPIANLIIPGILAFSK